MRLFLSISICLGMLFGAYGQLYVLKDYRADSNEGKQLLFDSVSILCDSFFEQLKFEELSSIKKFVPNRKYLKATFDTLDIEYTEDKVVIRQQRLLRGLQRQYSKIIKKAKKSKLKLKQLKRKQTEYDYGKNEEGHEYCYVTITCFKRKKEYELKFLVIRLNQKWFLGDELQFHRIE